MLSFFVRCDSRRSTPGGCFPQRSLSATDRVSLCKAGDFAEPFPPPLRASLRARRSSLLSRPAKGCSPFDPRQGRSPCTCPAPPFAAKPGLCFSRSLARENHRSKGGRVLWRDTQRTTHPADIMQKKRDGVGKKAVRDLRRIAKKAWSAKPSGCTLCGTSRGVGGRVLWRDTQRTSRFFPDAVSKKKEQMIRGLSKFA